jgi:4-diphosphocytidyl-2-C-methyl-D-erythritol kinase
LLDIPTGDDNLVVAALRRFSAVLGIEGGFACELDKTIPPGAGMGGASSDAAAVLRCAASVCGIPSRAPELFQIAAEIGSDVPFFLGDPAALAGSGRDSMDAARATGRGERLQRIELASALDFVVVYPGICLPTGKVYANSLVPNEPQTSCRLIEAIGRGNLRELSREMTNRLSEGAKKLAPPVDEILESLWRLGLRTCQLTGSGSACFAIVRSARQSRRIAARVRAMLEPGAIVVAARSTRVPAPIVMSMT